MEISQSLLIETAWIAGGYLGVIVFGLMLLRMARRPAKEADAPAKQTTTTVAATSPKHVAATPSQFVPLTSMVRSAEPVRPAGVSRTPATAHRNRQEVLRVARQMLTAGAPHNRIQAVLPVSAAELTLLEQTNK